MDDARIAQLREDVRGSVIAAGDEEYDAARRVYNAMIDRRPAVVVRPANTGDVMTAVRFAADNGLPVAVRGGSHSVPGFGTCDDGLVVDLSSRRGVRVDPLTSTARAEGGATWGDFNAATYPFGLATTGGIISTTGCGRSDAGWWDRLSRQRSRPVLRQPDLRRRGQRRRHVPRRQREGERDLFWAIRGGGGNFGVVTSLEFRLSAGQGHLRRTDVLRAGPGRGRAAVLPRVHRRRARAARRVPGVPDRTAAAVHSRGPAR